MRRGCCESGKSSARRSCTRPRPRAARAAAFALSWLATTALVPQLLGSTAASNDRGRGIEGKMLRHKRFFVSPVGLGDRGAPARSGGGRSAGVCVCVCVCVCRCGRAAVRRA